MQRWCLKCKVFGDENSFYPEAPEKALCKNCIKDRVRERNKSILDEADRLEREQEAVRGVIRHLQENNESYVYLIEHENKYKVGFSRNINKRIKSFNTSHAIPCKIISIIPGDSSLESFFHKRFSINRIKGEWFLKKPGILSEFKSFKDSVVFLPGYLKQ